MVNHTIFTEVVVLFSLESFMSYVLLLSPLCLCQTCLQLSHVLTLNVSLHIPSENSDLYIIQNL